MLKAVLPLITFHFIEHNTNNILQKSQKQSSGGVPQFMKINIWDNVFNNGPSKI